MKYGNNAWFHFSVTCVRSPFQLKPFEGNCVLASFKDIQRMTDNSNMLKLSTNAGFSKIQPFNFVLQKLSQNKIICDGPVLLFVTIMEPAITDQSKYYWKRKACNTRSLSFRLSLFPSSLTRNFSRGSQSVTARTRKEFKNPRAKRRQEIQLNIQFT